MPDPLPASGRPAASRQRTPSAEQEDQKAQPPASGRQRQTGSTRPGKPGVARAERHGTRWRDIEWVDFADETKADDSTDQGPVNEDPVETVAQAEADPFPTMTPADENDGFGEVLRQLGQPAPAAAKPEIPGLAPRFDRLRVTRLTAQRATVEGPSPLAGAILPKAPEPAAVGGDDRFPASLLTPVGTRPEPRPRPSITQALRARVVRARVALRPRWPAPPALGGAASDGKRESIGIAVRARLGRAGAALRPRWPSSASSPKPRAEPAPTAETPAGAPLGETIASKPRPRPAKPSPIAVFGGRIHKAALRLAGNDPERLHGWLRVAGTAIVIAVVAYTVGAIVAGVASSDTRRHTMSDQPARNPQTAIAQPQATPPPIPAPQPLVAAAPPSEPAARAAFYLARAKAGDPLAQYDIGVLYAQGSGLVQDYANAASWFHAAATQGNVDAEYNLGVLYERGLGVAASPIDAVNWYRSAADQNHPRAQYNLAIAYAEGRGTEQDFSAAARWYQRAAQQGLVPAMVNLAILYERGQGVARSPIDAFAWYSAAAERGDGPAKDRAGELLRQLPEQDRAKAQGLAATVAAAINGAPRV